MNRQTHRHTIRTIVRGAYDVQKLRIQVGNRIVANWKVKEGQAPGKSEDELDEKAKELLARLRKHYERITDGIVQFPQKKHFKGDEVISDYTELVLIAQYSDLLSAETSHFRRLVPVLADIPIYAEWLQTVKGIGPAMGGVIYSELDIHAAEYASSLWMYAGLDVAPDGKGRSSRKEHLVEREYINKKGEPDTKMSLTHNRFLKTKLTGVLGPSFLKAGGYYSEFYYNYKRRLESDPRHQEKTKAHRHNMAIRYMIKGFLVDLYRTWRTLEGLPVADEYAEGKLGMKHGRAA